MSTSRWSLFMTRFNRSVQQGVEGANRVIGMEGTNEPFRGPKTLLNLTRPTDLSQLAIGCDADIGGSSSAHLDFIAEPGSIEERRKGYTKFWGEMKLGVRPGMEGKMRSGYAGFRTKPRPTLFGELTHDISLHTLLALRVRLGGHPRTHNSWYVNIQTDSAVSGEVWQQRLPFQRDDGEWEDVYVPFSSFVLTSYAQQTDGQSDMNGEQVRWLGVSMLGGNDAVEGPFELGIESIQATNKAGVVHALDEEASQPFSVEEGSSTQAPVLNSTYNS